MSGELLLLRPAWLLALVPLALVAWRLRAQSARRGWAAVVDSHLAPAVLAPARGGCGVDVVLLVVAGVLAVVALAGPAQRGHTAAVWRADAARVLVIDLSPAMDAGEPAPLARVRGKLRDWLRAMADGETALIVYGEEPYLVAPLTSDAATLALFVPELASDVVPRPGDRPGPALRMAAGILATSQATTRDVLWFTAASDSAAARAAAAQALGDGLRLSVLHAAPTVDATLRAAVEATGGRYVLARVDGGDVAALAAALGTDAGVAAGPRMGAAPREVGQWLLPPLLLLVAYACRAVLGGVALVVLLPLVLALPPAHAADPDREAAALLAAGRPEDAAARFADARWRAVALYRAGRYGAAAATLEPFLDANSHYNRGNALARSGDYPAALAAFEAALAQRPADADARHNRDLMRRLLSGESGAPRAQDRPDSPRDAPPPAAAAEREAQMLAEQWLRRVPDVPGGLLRAKLAQEHRRRQAVGAGAPW